MRKVLGIAVFVLIIISSFIYIGSKTVDSVKKSMSHTTAAIAAAAKE